MGSFSWVGQYVVAALVFTVVDAIWLGTIAKGLYAAHLGHLLAPDTNKAAAVGFYAIFLVGLVYFVIHPAVVDGSWVTAAATGALFGVVTYATWDLTNLAVLKDFPASIVPIDMAWGAVLSATVSTLTTLIAGVVPELR